MEKNEKMRKRMKERKETDMKKKDGQKKIRPLVIVTALALVIAIGSFAAYFTSTDKAVNEYTVGNVTVEIDETFEIPDGGVTPGSKITKDVKIKNTGKNDCYVRIKAVFSDSDMEKHCTLDLNTSDFVYNESDGYYYYKKVLPVGDSTDSLFTKVTVSDEITQEQIKDFDIIVYAEGYQSEGFDSYQEAWEHYQINKSSS